MIVIGKSNWLITVLFIFASLNVSSGAVEVEISTGKTGFTFEDSVVYPNVQQRVQRAGNINMCQTNWGFWGSEMGRIKESPGGCFNPHPDSEVSAPSFEFPKESGLEYLFWGGIWVGAKIEDIPYVSLGCDGWQWNFELLPDGPEPLGAIEEISKIPGSLCYSPDAFSDQDIIASYTDTLVLETIWDRYPFWDPIDMRLHRPLNVKVIQKSYSWSDTDYGDFIIAEYVLKNIGDEVLSGIYVGLFWDTDIMHVTELVFDSYGPQDDITGFLKGHEISPRDTVEVDIAWAADNDGWGYYEDEAHWTLRSVVGVKILDISNPEVQLSYNWWFSCGNGLPYDWGPWKSENRARWAEENCYAPGDSFFPNHVLGTPGGDCSKYFIMSNGEIDYDQISSCIWPSLHPEQGWLPPNELCEDFADGHDTRFLLSFGPFDQTLPGDSITFVVAYIIGENFHTDPDNGENLPDNPDTFYAHLNFSDLVHKALIAQSLYDSLFFSPTDVKESKDELPKKFSLSQNYPNPFNTYTIITYEIEKGEKVTLKIYDILGREVKSLVNGLQRPGVYRVTWDGKDNQGKEVASGIYFYQLRGGNYKETRKLVLIK